MKIRFFVPFLLAVSLCHGAEDTPHFNRMNRGEMSNRRGMMGRGGMNRGGMRQNRFMSEIEIAKKFPKEYAELEAVREKYEADLNALANKAGVTLPPNMDAAMRQLRKADPAGFDAAAEKMKTSPRDGMALFSELAKKHGISLFTGRSGEMNGNHGAGEFQQPRVRQFNHPDMGALRRKYPEKMREYDELRRKNPEEARNMLLEIIKTDKSRNQ